MVEKTETETVTTETASDSVEAVQATQAAASAEIAAEAADAAIASAANAAALANVEAAVVISDNARNVEELEIWRVEQSNRMAALETATQEALRQNLATAEALAQISEKLSSLNLAEALESEPTPLVVETTEESVRVEGESPAPKTDHRKRRLI